MVPLQSAAPSPALLNPSPRQGIIRLMQHDKFDDAAGAISHDKDDVRSDHSQRKLQRQVQPSHERVRPELEPLRGKRMERVQTFPRESSGSRSGRDGGVSVISRMDLPVDKKGTVPTSSFYHPHHGHHAPWPSHSDVRRGGMSHGGVSRGMHRGGGGGDRSNRDADQNSRLDVDSQSSSTRPGQSSASGKLFDPRKDDPVRFSMSPSKSKQSSTSGAVITDSFSMSNVSTSTFSASSTSDMRSLTSVDRSTTASSEGRDRRRRRGPSSKTTAESSDRKKGDEGGESDNNSYVLELKRWYREIATLEHKLQEAHRSASEKQRLEQAEACSNMSTMKSSKIRANRPGYTATGGLDHSYWMGLVAQHQQLAELHAVFMEAALKPGLPASLHSIPESYKIPTRLWHTAFHSLLERLRHVLPSATVIQVTTDAEEKEYLHDLHSSVLDLLVEFIYFAYTFYSNLLENEIFKTFRSSWIESLGDLARYRMAVAKLMAKQDTNTRSRLAQGSAEEIASVIAKQVEMSSGDAEKEEGTQASVKQKGSIGSAALQDWDLEETEVWRSTAKDWYAKGLAEMPGIGRLHHHLGILSRDDELRGLHHFCKSLTTSHPYLSTRESILPLFERDLQLQRLRSDASLVDLFILLHGMLFTKVQLDDFLTIFARFEDRLVKITMNSRRNRKEAAEEVSPASWMMMATINITALLQYGAEVRETNSGPGLSKAQNVVDVGTGLISDDLDSKDLAEGEDETKEEGMKREAISATSNLAEEKPIALVFAARLTFTLLSSLISTSTAKDHAAISINPYVTMVLTFMSQECKQSALMDVMEQFIPWIQLQQLGCRIPPSIEPIDPRRDVPPRIRGDSSPLPEDWCLRGMAWVGRRVYERGFWKPSKASGGGGGASGGRSSSATHFDSEIEVLNHCTSCGLDANLSGDSSEEEGKTGGLKASMLLRWKRVAYTLTLLLRLVPGLDFEPPNSDVEGATGKIILSSPLKEKVYAWEVERELEEQQAQFAQLNVDLDQPASKSADTVSQVPDSIAVGSEEGIGSEHEKEESEEIRKLKERRNELLRQLQESRKLAQASAASSSPSQKKDVSIAKTHTNQEGSHLQAATPVVPTYTILILDTNVMLTPSNLVRKLVESKRWCAVVPLVTITELEGLTKRPGTIGQRAQRAIDYISSHVKSHSNYLKVQTSRGNYLNDLRFRTEEIDFSALPPPSSELAGMGHRDDEEDKDADTRAARSIDEVILFCLEWQNKNFVDRTALLSKDKDDLHRSIDLIDSETFKAALVTLDKNLRVKARFRGFAAISPTELADVPAAFTVLESP